MNITHYSRKTGEPLNPATADSDPRNKGEFLIPAYATPDVVPEIEENQCPVFTDENGAVPRSYKAGKWKIVADYRGYQGYDADGNEQKITELGQEPEESWTLTKPEPPFIFAEAVQTKLTDINSQRDQALKRQDATVEANGSTWQVDPNAMAELNDAITLSTALGAAPEGLEWRDSDNVNHPATLPLLLAIASARAVQKDAIWKHSWQLKAQLEALDSETATQADIDNIVVEFN